jgi:hypothetical protein
MLKISNLGFAAFLMLRDKKLISSPTKELGGKFEFYFDIQKTEYDKLLFDYTISDFAKFDNNLINLKKMLSQERK